VNVAGESPPSVLVPGFNIYRNDGGPYAPDLHVSLRVTGSASDSDHGVPNEVLIPEHETYVFVPLNAVDDSEPEWTEDVIVAMAPNQPFHYLEDQPIARLEIVDNDLAARGFMLQAA
jgi:hypothetical protein